MLGAAFANISLVFSLIAFAGVLVLACPPLLARRLTMSARGRGRAAQAGRDRGPILPSTPLGAVIGKELRMYSRSVLRSVMLMISFLVGVLAAVIPAFSGKTRARARRSSPGPAPR